MSGYNNAGVGLLVPNLPRLDTKSSMLCDRGGTALSCLGEYDDTVIDHEFVRRFTMATTAISLTFQIVIPKAVQDKFHLSQARACRLLNKRGQEYLFKGVWPVQKSTPVAL